MLSQKDVVENLAKNPNMPQHIAYQILSAYVYSKASRGNLPSEILSKLLSIARKISLRTGPILNHSAIARAFDACKSQLLQANRKWLSLGPLAYGSLGQIGAASTPEAKWCWTKATDGRVTIFRETDDGIPGIAPVDAGRIVGASYGPHVGLEEGPPVYSPPPDAQQNSNDPFNPTDSTADGAPPARELTEEERHVEAGRLHLARLREERLRKEQAAEEEARHREIEERERKQAEENDLESERVAAGSSSAVESSMTSVHQRTAPSLNPANATPLGWSA